MFLRWVWPPTKICPTWFFVVMVTVYVTTIFPRFLRIKAIDVPRGLLFPKWENGKAKAQTLNSKTAFLAGIWMYSMMCASWFDVAWSLNLDVPNWFNFEPTCLSDKFNIGKSTWWICISCQKPRKHFFKCFEGTQMWNEVRIPKTYTTNTFSVGWWSTMRLCHSVLHMRIRFHEQWTYSFHTTSHFGQDSHLPPNQRMHWCTAPLSCVERQNYILHIYT